MIEGWEKLRPQARNVGRTIFSAIISWKLILESLGLFANKLDIASSLPVVFYEIVLNVF